MRLSTLVLAALLAGFAGSSAIAEADVPVPVNYGETGGMTPEEVVAEASAAEAPADALSPEDTAALDGMAPEALEQAAPADMDPWEPSETGDVEVADLVAEAPAAPAEVTWEDFDDLEFDPTEAVEPAGVTPAAQGGQAAPAASLSARAAAIPIGPLGVDDNGVEGRIHMVNLGETLWDISEAYLGTPWVWPSVWYENADIDDPHLIEPGDRIWITSNEMRLVSDEEADVLVAAVGDESDADLVSDPEMFAFDEEAVVIEDDAEFADEPLPAAVEDDSELDVAMPVQMTDAATGEVLVLASDRSSNFATASLMDDASTIVDAPTLRVYLTQADPVFLALGEGEVQVGDEFEIFRDVVRVRDPETGAVLGYHYDELGWLRIVEVEGESSTGIIQGAYSEIQRGDRVVPRYTPPQAIAVRSALEPIEGSIVFTPGLRWMAAQTDAVYVNVGSIHGIELGTQLEVFDRGGVMSASKMPDTVIAELVVIGVEPETSIAFITETDRELTVGDSVRGVMSGGPLSQR